MTYIKEVIFTAIICGIITGLTAIGKTEISKYVKYAASLAFLCILLSPFLNSTVSYSEILEDIKNIPDGEYSEADDTSEPSSSLEVISNEICKAAISNAAEEFGISPDDFRIKIILHKSNSGEYSIKEATVYISDEAEEIGIPELKRYFQKILNCDIEVISSDQANANDQR